MKKIYSVIPKNSEHKPSADICSTALSGTAYIRSGWVRSLLSDGNLVLKKLGFMLVFNGKQTESIWCTQKYRMVKPSKLNNMESKRSPTVALSML